MKIIIFLWLLLSPNFVQSTKPVRTSQNILGADKMAACPDGEFCWQKCCKVREYFDIESATCTPTENAEHLKQPEIYELSINEDHNVDLELLPPKKFTILEWYGQALFTQICNTSLNFTPATEKVSFLSSGKLLIESFKEWKVISKKFCVENFVNITSGAHFLSAFTCSENPACDANKPWMKKVACKDVVKNEVRRNNY